LGEQLVLPRSFLLQLVDRVLSVFRLPVDLFNLLHQLLIVSLNFLRSRDGGFEQLLDDASDSGFELEPVHCVGGLLCELGLLFHLNLGGVRFTCSIV